MTNGAIGCLLVALFVLAGPNAARADGTPAAGQRVYAKCGACHPVAADGRHGVGPNLRGVVGRRAGSVPGFGFSAALRRSPLYWTEPNLRISIRRPKDLVAGCGGPGTLGVRNPQEIEDVLAYLKSLK